jgi:hypothetical protein
MTPYSVEVTDVSKELDDTALLWQDVDTRLHGVRTQILKTLTFAAVKKDVKCWSKQRQPLQNV